METQNSAAGEKTLAAGIGRRGAEALKKIVSSAYEALGNPLVMFDTSYNLLAFSENRVDDDPLWNEFVSNGVFSHETVDFFNRAQFIRAVSDCDVVTLLKHEDLKYDRACAKFFDGNGIQLGNITVVACYRPFCPQDYKVMEEVCQQIADEIENNAAIAMTERVFYEKFISDLLENNASPQSLADSLGSLYSDHGRHIFLLTADISRYDQTLSHLAYLRDTLAALQEEFRYFIYLNNIVILASFDKPIIDTAKDLGKLNSFFIKYNIYAGVSDSFGARDLGAARSHYRQAVAALNYGMSRNPGCRIYRYDDYRVDYFLDCIKGRVDIIGLVNPIVSSIRDHDEKNGTDYCETLKAYLFNGQNADMTSKSLGMYQEALHKRLKEISDIFSINYSDGNLLFSITASYKVLDCLE
jgi:hypothetical protein